VRTGEIHVGPGRHLWHAGGLVEAAGWRYRANASHNAGILYHEYGHHVVCHTADCQANRLRPSEQQNNVKAALDEGTSDYLAAALLETPHIWAWHRTHTCSSAHPRSLASTQTMADFDTRPGADPHANGTIWGAALWDLRRNIAAIDSSGARAADLLVLKALILLGAEPRGASRSQLRSARRSFSCGLRALLAAAEELGAGRHADAILARLGRRGISPADAPRLGGWL
jgi:hypothetical protein